MKFKDLKIGFALTGSFCTFSKTIPKIKELVKEGAEVIPIMSYNAYSIVLIIYSSSKTIDLGLVIGLSCLNGTK